MDFGKLDNRSTKRLLIDVGMPNEIVDNLFITYRKKVSPNPQGYVAPETTTREIVVNSFTFQGIQENIVEQAKMVTLGHMSAACLPIPWYWLSRELAQDLIEVEFSEIIPKDIVLPKFGIIVLPKNLIKTSTGKVNFIAYHLFAPGEVSTFDVVIQDENKNGEKSTFETHFQGRYGHRLSWVAPDSECVYGGIMGLIGEENCFKIDIDRTEYIDNPELEDQETKQISGLLLNCLIYASQHETEYTITKSKGFSKNSNKKANKKGYDKPIFIGKDYVSVVNKTLESSGIKGTSKRIHWRKGHWRRIAVGEGRKQRVWRLIPPVLVNVSKTKN